MSFIHANLIHILAAIWFVICWGGYTRYATWKGRDTACLASVLHLYREDWMRRMLLRDNRIADASVVGNLERNASFFASSTLIIWPAFSPCSARRKGLCLCWRISMVQQASQGMSEIKLLCLALVFVYAFFTFSWCMRQYNFAAILIGSAPMVGERHVSEQERKAFAARAARVISMAANQFNFGLRSYYFGMTMLAWFVSPWLFMLMSAGVVLVLYRREFHSDVLDVMVYTPTERPCLKRSRRLLDEYSVLVCVYQRLADLRGPHAGSQGHERAGWLQQSPATPAAGSTYRFRCPSGGGPSELLRSLHIVRGGGVDGAYHADGGMAD